MISLLRENFEIIKQEGLAITNHLKVDDWRSDDWYIAPLKVEEEDSSKNRSLS